MFSDNVNSNAPTKEVTPPDNPESKGLAESKTTVSRWSIISLLYLISGWMFGGETESTAHQSKSFSSIFSTVSLVKRLKRLRSKMSGSPRGRPAGLRRSRRLQGLPPEVAEELKRARRARRFERQISAGAQPEDVVVSDDDDVPDEDDEELLNVILQKREEELHDKEEESVFMLIVTSIFTFFQMISETFFDFFKGTKPKEEQKTFRRSRRLAGLAPEIVEELKKARRQRRIERLIITGNPQNDLQDDEVLDEDDEELLEQIIQKRDHLTKEKGHLLGSHLPENPPNVGLLSSLFAPFTYTLSAMRNIIKNKTQKEDQITRRSRRLAGLPAEIAEELKRARRQRRKERQIITGNPQNCLQDDEEPDEDDEELLEQIIKQRDHFSEKKTYLLGESPSGRRETSTHSIASYFSNFFSVIIYPLTVIIAQIRSVFGSNNKETAALRRSRRLQGLSADEARQLNRATRQRRVERKQKRGSLAGDIISDDEDDDDIYDEDLIDKILSDRSNVSKWSNYSFFLSAINAMKSVFAFQGPMHVNDCDRDFVPSGKYDDLMSEDETEDDDNIASDMSEAAKQAGLLSMPANYVPNNRESSLEARLARLPADICKEFLARRQGRQGSLTPDEENLINELLRAKFSEERLDKRFISEPLDEHSLEYSESGSPTYEYSLPGLVPAFYFDHSSGLKNGDHSLFSAKKILPSFLFFNSQKASDKKNNYDFSHEGEDQCGIYHEENMTTNINKMHISDPGSQISLTSVFAPLSAYFNGNQSSNNQLQLEKRRRRNICWLLLPLLLLFLLLLLFFSSQDGKSQLEGIGNMSSALKNSTQEYYSRFSETLQQYSASTFSSVNKYYISSLGQLQSVSVYRHMSSLGNKLQQVLSFSVSSVYKVFSTLFSSIVAAIVSVSTAVSDTLSIPLQHLYTASTSVLTATAATVSEIPSLATTPFTFLSSVVVKTVSSTASLASSLVQHTANGLHTASSWTWDLIALTFSWLAHLSKHLPSMWNGFGSVWTTIYTYGISLCNGSISMFTSLTNFASSCLLGAGSWLASLVLSFGESCKVITVNFAEAMYEIAANSVQYLGSGAINGLNWSFKVGKGGLQYGSASVASAFSSVMNGISNAGVAGAETIQNGLFSLKDGVTLGFKGMLNGLNGSIMNFISLSSLNLASFGDVCLNFASTSVQTIGNTLHTMLYTFKDSVGLCLNWISSGLSNSIDCFRDILVAIFTPATSPLVFLSGIVPFFSKAWNRTSSIIYSPSVPQHQAVPPDYDALVERILNHEKFLKTVEEMSAKNNLDLDSILREALSVEAKVSQKFDLRYEDFRKEIETIKSSVHDKEIVDNKMQEDKITNLEVKIELMVQELKTKEEEKAANNLREEEATEKLDAELIGMKNSLEKLESDLSTMKIEMKTCCQSNEAITATVQQSIRDMLTADNADENTLLALLSKYFATKSELGDINVVIEASKQSVQTEVLEFVNANYEKGNSDALISELMGKLKEREGEMQEVGLGENEVSKIVENALIQYDADKTGMFDYALETAGGSVISTRCTETFVQKSAMYSLFGIPIWYPSNNPRTVIQPGVLPGECWAFKGSSGFIVIQLTEPVLPTQFSIEHISKSMSPSGKIDSAPREFEVYGLMWEKDTDPVLLGQYLYRDDSVPLQFFQVCMYTC